MKCIIFANGEYGPAEAYQSIIEGSELIICADGGANYAYKLGVVPRLIIGDLDSILPEVREYYIERKVSFQKYPRQKDFTDMELALAFANKEGADEIVFLGSLGKRLDHTLANLYCGMNMVREGKKFVHFNPDYDVYLLSNSLRFTGQKGDLVSIVTLSDRAFGVYIRGFEYPLDNALLEKENPIGISNILNAECGEIELEDGVLAVIHYKK
ncbi:MAG: thiamine diphosphokinase [Syntrophomonas sp.]